VLLYPQEGGYSVLVPALLQAVVEQTTSGLDPSLARARATCPGRGRTVATHGRPRRRQVTTQCGTVTLERPWYHGGPCGHGWSAVETTLGVAGRTRLSEGLRRWVVQLGAAAPVDEAAEVLAELVGLDLGALEIVRWEGGVTGRGLAVLREVALYGDAAAWIWRLAEERFDARIEVVDAYHAYQHLHVAARALFGDTPAATAWVDQGKANLLTVGIEPVLTALRAKARTPDAA
jgi:hypothetical protein